MDKRVIDLVIIFVLAGVILVLVKLKFPNREVSQPPTQYAQPYFQQHPDTQPKPPEPVKKYYVSYSCPYIRHVTFDSEQAAQNLSIELGNLGFDVTIRKQRDASRIRWSLVPYVYVVHYHIEGTKIYEAESYEEAVQLKSRLESLECSSVDIQID